MSELKTLVVYHNEYGCETGCCGHTIELDGKSEFAFAHPTGYSYPEDPIEFAKRLLVQEFGAEHLADVDWDNARIEVSND